MARYYLDGILGKLEITESLQKGFMAEEDMAILNINALLMEVPDITKKEVSMCGAICQRVELFGSIVDFKLWFAESAKDAKEFEECMRDCLQ